MRICEGIAGEKSRRALGVKAVPLVSAEDCEASDVLHELASTWAVGDLSGEVPEAGLVRRARK